MRTQRWSSRHQAACRRRAPARRTAARAGKNAQNMYSEMVDQALLLYIFQQDLGVQLQRALNQDQFDIATQIRAKREQVQISHHLKNGSNDIFNFWYTLHLCAPVVAQQARVGHFRHQECSPAHFTNPTSHVPKTACR